MEFSRYEQTTPQTQQTVFDAHEELKGGGAKKGAKKKK